jgi:hypothetical protein
VVQASHPGTTWTYAIKADGCYRFKSLEPGDWSVTTGLRTGYPQFFRDGKERQGQSHITVAPGASEAVLDLDLALGDRTLTVRPTGAEKPGELCLRLLLPDGGTLVEYACQEADGAFHVSRLRAGSYRIQILDRKDQIVMKGSVELTSDREMVIDLKEAR